MNWKQLTINIDEPRSVWRARIGGKTLVGEQAINSAVRKWQPSTPLLIAPPGAARYVPVLEVAEFSAKARASACRTSLRSLLVVIALAVVFLILFAVREARVGVAVLLIALTGYLASEYMLVTTNEVALRERARFFVWIYARGRTQFYCWLAFAVVIGLLQYVMEHTIGGRDALLLRLGVVYQAVENGDWWRIFTGPVLHANIAHWVINAAMLIIVSSVVGALSKTAVAWAFVLGNIFSAFGAILMNELLPTGAVGYVGMSGGVFAILGCGIGIAIRQSYNTPYRLAFTLLGFSALMILAAWVFDADVASFAAHLTGLCIGVILGSVQKWRI